MPFCIEYQTNAAMLVSDGQIRIHADTGAIVEHYLHGGHHAVPCAAGNGHGFSGPQQVHGNVRERLLALAF